MMTMKKMILSLAFLSTIFTACTSKDDDTSTPPPVGSTELTGEVTTTKTYPKGNYTLNGYFKIKSGATVTFEAGSTITSVATSIDAIVVENGAKIFMNGTAAEPIICTSSKKESGAWGGIVIYGNAPIVASTTATTASSEDGLAITYGGTEPAHSSGSLKYVRVEYAGKKIADGTKELNGFSFYAVGSGTVLENLVAYKGNDDGFEFYGGTVSATNLVSYGNADDSFDWQDGWRGQNSTNWYAYQVGIGNFGMEIEAKSVDNAFWPVVSNITLRRASGTVTEGGGSASEYDAIQFKKQGNGYFSNVIISGYSDASATAVRIQDDATNTAQVKTGKIKLTNVKIDGSTSKFAGIKELVPVFSDENYTISATATGATLSAGAWATVDGVNLLGNL
jgi:hypothetical protein